MRDRIAVHGLTGTSRVAFISSIIGSGKTISAFSRAMPSAIRRAASSASSMNGMRKVFASVSPLRTKAGQTVIAVMPSGIRSMRSDSSRWISAALVAP